MGRSAADCSVTYDACQSIAQVGGVIGQDGQRLVPPALPLHAHHDVARTAPVVEAAVQELELRRARLEGEEVEGGAEQSATSILITTGVASPPLQSPR